MSSKILIKPRIFAGGRLSEIILNKAAKQVFKNIYFIVGAIWCAGRWSAHAATAPVLRGCFEQDLTVISYVKFDFIYYILFFGLINKISNLIIEEGGVLGFEPDIENLPIIR